MAILVGGKLRAMATPPEVLTSQQLSEVYQGLVYVIPHPEYITPSILLDGHDPRSMPD
jgi:ABC-type hemin transport system ATPase subunit